MKKLLITGLLLIASCSSPCVFCTVSKPVKQALAGNTRDLQLILKEGKKWTDKQWDIRLKAFIIRSRTLEAWANEDKNFKLKKDGK